MNAPTHMAKHASGGSTTPSPMLTAESGKRPRVVMRRISNVSAATVASAIEMTAEAGRLLRPEKIRSDTPFHCTAEGMANWSEIRVAVERTPFASGARKSRKNSGVEASAPASKSRTALRPAGSFALARSTLASLANEVRRMPEK